MTKDDDDNQNNNNNNDDIDVSIAAAAAYNIIKKFKEQDKHIAELEER